MSNLQSRLVNLHFDAEHIESLNAKQREAFYAAIGYQALWGVSASTPEFSTRLVSVMVDKRGEITSATYPKIPPNGPMARYSGSAEQIITDALKALQALSPGHIFVMGGIPNRDKTEYSFHS